MIRWALSLIATLALGASAAKAGVVQVFIEGQITGFEQNPVTGSTQTTYDPAQGNRVVVFFEVLGYPDIDGVVDIPTPNEASYLTGVIIAQYVPNVWTTSGYGFAGRSNDEEIAISADVTFDKGKVVDLNFLTLDRRSRSQNRPDGLIRVEGETLRFGYDGTYAPSFTDATTIARLDIGTARYTYLPETETWALMIMGFGFAGCAARKQRGVRFGLA